MGRARGSGASSFDGVLGAGRGSAGAQRQRDAAEREVSAGHHRAFTRAVDRGATKSGWHGRIGETWVADELFAAYGRGDCVPGAPGYTKLVAHLRDDSEARSPAGVIAAISYGDPVGCPGLTTPAVEGLATYLNARLSRSDRRRRNGDALATVCGLFRIGPYQPAYYERLQGVCEGLGKLIAAAPKSSPGGPILCGEAAEAMYDAPLAVLVGPMSTWAPAFAKRLRRDYCNLTAVLHNSSAGERSEPAPDVEPERL